VIRQISSWLEKRPTIAWTLVISYAVIIIALSSIPGSSLPSEKVPLQDTIEHIIEYAILGFLLIIAFLSTGYTLDRKTILVVIIVGAIYAVFDESYQSFVSDRIADVLDVFSDIVGVTLGVIIRIKKG